MILSAAVAILIFVGLTRKGARDRPVVWFGAVLVAFGAVGFFDSLSAASSGRVRWSRLSYAIESVTGGRGILNLHDPRSYWAVLATTSQIDCRRA
jgi:hypothetical protein